MDASRASKAASVAGAALALAIILSIIAITIAAIALRRAGRGASKESLYAGSHSSPLPPGALLTSTPPRNGAGMTQA